MNELTLEYNIIYTDKLTGITHNISNNNLRLSPEKLQELITLLVEIEVRDKNFKLTN